MAKMTPINRPYRGTAVGDTFEVADRYAKALVFAKRAQYAVEKPVVVTASVVEDVPEEDPKRKYKRRDMRAEE